MCRFSLLFIVALALFGSSAALQCFEGNGESQKLVTCQGLDQCFFRTKIGMYAHHLFSSSSQLLFLDNDFWRWYCQSGGADNEVNVVREYKEGDKWIISYICTTDSCNEKEPEAKCNKDDSPACCSQSAGCSYRNTHNTIPNTLSSSLTRNWCLQHWTTQFGNQVPTRARILPHPRWS